MSKCPYFALRLRLSERLLPERSRRAAQDDVTQKANRQIKVNEVLVGLVSERWWDLEGAVGSASKRRLLLNGFIVKRGISEIALGPS
jgi:hypothetical protein